MENTGNENQNIIEAILFWKGEPVTIKEISKLVNISIEDVQESIEKLGDSLKNRGIILQKNGDEVMLGTDPRASKIIENLTREELSKELSKATLETLSIIVYMSPIRRSEIDYIRGVNSQFSVRHLETRGLIEKVTSETDSRVYLYKPTFEALSFLGVTELQNMEGFSDTRDKLLAFKESKNQTESEVSKDDSSSHHEDA